jgi:hypothetical protein
MSKTVKRGLNGLKSTGIVRKVDELGRVVILSSCGALWELILRMPWKFTWTEKRLS